MEEKLSKLLLEVNRFSEKSQEHYAEIKFDGDNKKVEISIRTKQSFDYVETRSITLNFTRIDKIDELIEFLKNYT